MDYQILNNDLVTWAIALVIAAAVCALLAFARRLVVRRMQAFAGATATYLDELAILVLSATHPLFILAVGLYAGAHWLALPEKNVTLLARLAIAALLLRGALGRRRRARLAPLLPHPAQRPGRGQHHLDRGAGLHGAHRDLGDHRPNDPR